MRKRLEYVGILLVRAWSRLLPDVGALAMGSALGRLFYRLGIRRSVSLGNLQRALGTHAKPHELEEICKRTYEHFGRALVEFLRLTPRTARSHGRRLELHGGAHLQRALQQGRGAIVASAHCGNWEVVCAAAASQGLPVTLVVQKLNNPATDALLQSIRQSVGLHLLDRGMALRRVKRELEANRLVAIMCDQDARRRGIFVPFFGTPASTHKGAAQLALRLDVPFIPLFARRFPDGSHHAFVHAPLEPRAGLDEDAVVRDLMQQYTTLLEQRIREQPDQYLWSHRRWKTHAPKADHPAPGAEAMDGPALPERTIRRGSAMQ